MRTQRMVEASASIVVVVTGSYADPMVVEARASTVEVKACASTMMVEA